MLTRIKTASLIGVTGYVVDVETDVHSGLPNFNVVGLADTTIKESLRRIRPAITNSGFQFPSQRITVNLVPAGKPKEGSHFDLPIALGILLTSLECKCPDDTAFFGEVSLDGKINGIRGALPLAMVVRNEGIKNIIVPWENAEEVSILKDVNVIAITNLSEAVGYVMEPEKYQTYRRQSETTKARSSLDFRQVIGHEGIKRALVIATAGKHGVLMMGGPGCGKTMMAKRIPTIMPKLSYEEQLEITGIYSISGMLGKDQEIVATRPFRSPHHTISAIGLTGGGSGRVRPGELSLAHGGVLFLDELGEFDNRAIDAMRQPLEEGKIRINRNNMDVVFPCETMIVVASNPCKCGYLWDDRKVCTCTSKQINAHQRKLDGPFADRIDMHLKVTPVSRENIENASMDNVLSSEEMRMQVEQCRQVQDKRYCGTRYPCNGSLDEQGIKKYCQLNESAQSLLNVAYEKMNMTMRGYSKVIKLARTIADLEGSQVIGETHVAEALVYRM